MFHQHNYHSSDPAPSLAKSVQQTFECSVCFESFGIDEQCVKCFSSGDTSEGAATSSKADETHLICLTCIKSYAHASITGSSVAFGGIGLKCVEPECKNVFLLSSFEFCIDNIDYFPLKERLQQQCIADANLEDLVTCSGCGLKGCVSPTQLYYVCECGRKNCRSCHRIFDHKHFNKTCQQMDQDEANDISLRNLESKMSEAVIRKCNKCGISYVKKDGCNKMECTCGAKQCYICKQQDIDYAHFCLCGITDEQHGPCSRCKKTCRIWENNEEVDNIKINEILDSANPLLKEREAGPQFSPLPTGTDNQRPARHDELRAAIRQNREVVQARRVAQQAERLREQAARATPPPPRQLQPPQPNIRPYGQNRPPFQHGQERLPNHRALQPPRQQQYQPYQNIQPIIRVRLPLQKPLQMSDFRYPPPPILRQPDPRQPRNQRPQPPPQFQQQMIPNFALLNQANLQLENGQQLNPQQQMERYGHRIQQAIMIANNFFDPNQNFPFYFFPQMQNGIVVNPPPPLYPPPNPDRRE